MSKAPAFVLGLPMLYLSWIVALAILYRPYRWFANIKQRRRDWWLSYS